MSLRNIPEELKTISNWVGWKWKKKEDGSLTKPPYDLKSNGTLRLASTTDPSTWTTFEAADAECSGFGTRLDGVGIVLPVEIGGTDFDGVIVDETPEPYVLEILKHIGDPYTEITPSGNGLRAFFKAPILPTTPTSKLNCKFNGKVEGKKKYAAEIYFGGRTNRYLTVTGDKFSGDGMPTPQDIDFVYFLISQFGNEKFKTLWMGDISKHDNDQSRADMALAGMLARLLNNDAKRIEKYFGASILGQREKWTGRSDYRERTIAAAISGKESKPETQNEYSESGTAPPTEQFVATEPVEDLAKLLHPKLSDDALYGLAGDIVKRIMPQTESHPAGLLVQILMYFGNIIGHNAYFQVESTRHYGNLFAVRVGETSKARKGTGGDRINALFEQVAPEWLKTRVRSGLSSNEGLIVAIGDEELGEDRRGQPIVLCGAVRDKRLLSYEGEFSQLLVVMQRPGNTISTNVRNAWDGKSLRTMTIKPRCATNHTVSILGDITRGETKTKMTGDDATNGFGNRFLWVHVERTKLLPFGGEDINFGPYIEDLKKAIEFAEGQRRIFMDENARKVWSRAYKRLSNAHDGLFGAVTSRGEAQVIRLALLYALLDCSDHIRSEHLQAALALWQYCEDSARFIFDELTVEQQMIVEHLRQHGSQTKTDFLKGLFNRNRAAAEIIADLAALERRGLVSHCQNKKRVTVYFVQVRS